MPSLEQLPEAAIANPTDLLLLDQGGSYNSVSVQVLQSGLQPKLTLAPGALLGRVSPAPGQPEPVGIGAGLTLNAATLLADTTIIAPLASPALTGTPTAPTPPVGDSSTRVATTAFVQAKLASPITLGGDITGTGPSSNGVVTTTLPSITTPGTYIDVVVNAKGQVTGGTTLPSGGAVELQSNKGAPSGYAGLDATAKVPLSQLPSGIGAVASVVGQTGAITATQISSALGLGSLASENANAVALTGGSIDATTIGATTPAAGSFTALKATANATVPTVASSDNSTNAASTAYVKAQGYISASGAPVQSVAGRTGAISLAVADITGAAPLASPALTGAPTAPTPGSSDNSTSVATTAFVKAQSYITASGAPVQSVAGRTGAVTLAASDVSGAAPLASPALTGTPTSPTASVNTNTTQLATTAFVLGQAANTVPLTNGTASVGSSTQFARQDHVHPTDISRAPLASPALTGTPMAPTPASTDNSTALATTAFVKAQNYITSSGAPVQSVAGQTGAVTDLSAGTSKSSGSSLSRSLAARGADRFNVVDYGADPTGAADSTSALTTIAGLTGPAGRGTVYFPSGTYNFAGNAYFSTGVVLEMDAGCKFTGTGTVIAQGDASVLSGGNAGMAHLNISSNDGNYHAQFISHVIAGSSGSTSYEKSGLYVDVGTYDVSAYSAGTSLDTVSAAKDVVAIQATANIFSGNSVGRAAAITTISAVQSGADGSLGGIEVDMVNNGVSQPENNRFNTKTAFNAVSFGPNAITTAYQVSNDGGTFYDAYSVLKSAATRYAFVIRDLSTYPSGTPFAVDASGNVNGQNVIAAGSLQANGLASFGGGLADASYSSQTPTTGFAITVSNGVSTLQLTPAGALASGAITMPSTPGNGQWLLVASTQTISSVTFTPSTGQTILGAPTSLPGGVEVAFQYQSGSSRWVCQSGNDSRVANSATAATLTFGTGVDGTVALSSGTTTFTRDMHWANCTVSGSALINTNGWRMFVAGMLDVSAAQSGAIVYNGGGGASASSATGAFAPGGLAMRTVGQSPTSGGAGGGGTSAAGTTGTAGAANTCGNGGNGGAGGTGGTATGAGGTGGTGGLQTVQIPLNTPTVTFYPPASGSSIAAGLIGGGGGGGGGDGSYAGGGGGAGGSFGGTIAIYARNIQRGSNANTAIIQAKGGSGGNGANALGGNAAGGGGGGGGGGGCVYIVTEALLGSSIANAIDVSGGAGGTGGAGSGTGKGGAGGTGGASGSVQILNLLSPAYTASTWNISGSAGGTTATTTGGTAGAGTTLRVTL